MREPGFVIISRRRSHRGGEAAEQEDDEILGQLCSDWVSRPPASHSHVFEDGKPTSTSAPTPRDPNGEGLPLWPAYSQKEQYLQLDLNLSVGQRLKAPKVEFWTETLPLMMSTSGGHLGPPSSLLFLSLLLPFMFPLAR